MAPMGPLSICERFVRPASVLARPRRVSEELVSERLLVLDEVI